MSSRPSPLKSPATPLKPPPAGGAATAAEGVIWAAIVMAVTAASASRRRFLCMFVPVSRADPRWVLPEKKVASKAALGFIQSTSRPARAKPVSKPPTE
ncbi:hypothetical protein Ani05nite_25890 [Amorphoplanes nipponensis]|uniref:Uncharacterized protein n=1 Tax=Actinoplanes nipponensis TaxID=135950 RepID=A0A919MTF4_9ACTN|nr:hypothetical protein Ani05nite_25890 [Actinoplanes nipponensis]